MIVTTKQAYNEITSLMSDTFSKQTEEEAKSYQNYASEGEKSNGHAKKKQKVDSIALDLYKIVDAIETKAYTDSLPIEVRAALIDRFVTFLSELNKIRHKKIEMPYSRNLRLKLILVDFNDESFNFGVKHRL